MKRKPKGLPAEVELELIGVDYGQGPDRHGYTRIGERLSPEALEMIREYARTAGLEFMEIDEADEAKED